MKGFLPYATVALLTLSSSTIYSAEPTEARKLADYAVKHGSHRIYEKQGRKVDSHFVSFKIRETLGDILTELEIGVSRLLVDGREDLSLVGQMLIPPTGDYLRIQVDDGGIMRNLPLDGKVDAIEMATSKDKGKTFQQNAVPKDAFENRQNIFDVYVSKVMKIIKE